MIIMISGRESRSSCVKVEGDLWMSVVSKVRVAVVASLLGRRRYLR